MSEQQQSDVFSTAARTRERLSERWREATVVRPDRRAVELCAAADQALGQLGADLVTTARVREAAAYHLRGRWLRA